MLFGMSTIIFKWSHSSDINIFQSCFKIGQSQSCVAYESVGNESVAFERKSVSLTHTDWQNRF